MAVVATVVGGDLAFSSLLQTLPPLSTSSSQPCLLIPPPLDIPTPCIDWLKDATTRQARASIACSGRPRLDRLCRHMRIDKAPMLGAAIGILRPMGSQLPPGRHPPCNDNRSQMWPNANLLSGDGLVPM